MNAPSDRSRDAGNAGVRGDAGEEMLTDLRRHRTDETMNLIADWVATSGLAPEEGRLIVARLATDVGEVGANLHAASLLVPHDSLLLVVGRVSDEPARRRALRALREWRPSRRGLHLVRFEDLATESGAGSWWRLTYRRTGA